VLRCASSTKATPPSGKMQPYNPMMVPQAACTRHCSGVKAIPKKLFSRFSFWRSSFSKAMTRQWTDENISWNTVFVNQAQFLEVAMHHGSQQGIRDRSSPVRHSTVEETSESSLDKNTLNMTRYAPRSLSCSAHLPPIDRNKGITIRKPNNTILIVISILKQKEVEESFQALRLSLHTVFLLQRDDSFVLVSFLSFPEQARVA
jgi:hypothetical protein